MGKRQVPETWREKSERLIQDAILKRDAARQEKDTARRLAEREARRRAHEAALEDPLRPTTAQLFQRRTQRSLSLTDAKLVAMKLEEKRIPERRRRHTDSAIDLPALDPETEEAMES